MRCDTNKKPLPGLTSVEEQQLIDSVAFSSDKLDTLRATCSFVIDARENNATILEAFAFSSDKATYVQYPALLRRHAACHLLPVLHLLVVTGMPRQSTVQPSNLVFF